MYPQRVVEGDKMGGMSESQYKKGGPCRCRTVTLKNPAKINVYGVGSPTVGTTSSIRLHICAVVVA